jgi:hypothetical protein
LSCDFSSIFAGSWDPQNETGPALVPLAAAVGLTDIADGEASNVSEEVDVAVRVF